MRLCEALQIERGVTAIIGAGGKTTLLLALARELRREGTVIVCTSTHILPPPLPLVTKAEEIASSVQKYGAVCVGTPAEDGKLTAPPVSFGALAASADFVPVEADGAHGLPLKAHASHEPVIPPGAKQTVLVAGLSAIGKPIRQVVHRPEIFCEITGSEPDALLSPQLAAKLIRSEALHTRVFLNQADGEAHKASGRQLAALLDCPVCMGALERGYFECLF